MMKWIIGGIAFLAVGALIVFATLFFAIGGHMYGAANQAQTSNSCQTSTTAAAATVTVSDTQLSASQLHYAELILGVARTRHLPAIDGAIGVATAMQESSLSNPTVATDHDSLGLFQQRPSIMNANGTPYWGTPAQLVNPTYAANRFFTDLVEKVPSPNRMSITQAAQIVQGSAYPQAYEQWAGMATKLASQAYGQALTVTPAVATLTSCQGTITVTASTAVAVKAVKAALSQVGLPYIWGGETKGVGFDCSGLIQWAYSQAGLSLPRVANAQYNAISKKVPVSLSALEPGDTLYESWDEEGPGTGWGHTLMYIGNGQVVEAPQTGENVKIISLASSGAVVAARPTG